MKETLGKSVSRGTLIALLFVLGSIVIHTRQCNFEIVVSFATLVLSFSVIRRKTYSIPFSLYAAVYTVNLLIGVLYIEKAFEWNLLMENSSHSFSKSIFWLFGHLFLVAIGIAAASYFLKTPIPTEKVYRVSPTMVLLLWGASFLLVLVERYYYGTLGLFAVFVLPITTMVAVNIKWRKRIKYLILFTSGFMYLVYGNRWIIGLLLIWLVGLSIFNNTEKKLSRYVFWKKAIGVLVLGVSIFVSATYFKYGYTNLSDVIHQSIQRLVFTTAHATLSVKEREYTVSEGVMYWFALFPGVEKPINTGHLVYKISRERGTSGKDVPYLPPTVPAELIMTIGMTGLIIGSLLIGILVSLFWYLALKTKNCSFGSTLFIGASIILSGVGGTSLYGRVNSVKIIVLAYVFYLLMSRISGRNSGRYRTGIEQWKKMELS